MLANALLETSSNAALRTVCNHLYGWLAGEVMPLYNYMHGKQCRNAAVLMYYSSSLSYGVTVQTIYLVHQCLSSSVKLVPFVF
jgi:hypothetical protein